MTNARARRGRPSKFGRPSHTVTITLPDDVVMAFRALDPDLSRAIVHASETAGARLLEGPAVALTRYGQSAVIVLTPNKAIEQLPGVALIPLPDGRALISLDKDTGIAEFEVLVRDAMDSVATSAPDRHSLQLIGDILRSARRSRNVQLSERNIIVLETADRRTAIGPHGRLARGKSRGELQT
jgi:hypothetical protein